MNFDYKKMIKPVLNVGDREQRIRLLTGTVLVFISIFAASIILLLIGLVLIATGYFGRCPAYAAINYNTLDKNVAAASNDKAEKKAEPAAKKPVKKSSTASKPKAATKKTTTESKVKTPAKKATTKAKSTAKK